MKRTLFQNITAIPYTDGSVIDRTGFLSAVIGANVNTSASVTVKVEHSDDNSTFVPVTDERVFPEKQTEGGEYTFEYEGEEAGVVNIDIDLVGLKPFVKFTITGIEGSPVVVLGDAAVQPV